MNEEEKYKQIAESRQSDGNGDKQQGGVNGSDPQDDNKPGSEEKPEKGETKETTDTPKELTPEEKQQHAFAEMRFRYKRETDALKRKIAELEKAMGAGKKDSVPKKGRADFKTDDEYGDYMRDTMAESIYKRVKEQLERENAANTGRSETRSEITRQLDAIKPGLGNAVYAEMNDPNTLLHEVLTDQRAEPMVNAIGESARKAEILLLMRNNPERFARLAEQSPERQRFQIFQLEQSLEMIRSQRDSAAKAEDERRKRAESLPTAGTFGVNGNGNTNIGGLSPAERIRRYKAEMRKNGII